MQGQADPLAGFRARGARPPPASQATPSRYRAFDVAAGGAKPSRLDIRVKSGMSVARLYGSITEIAYDRDAYSGILLVVPGKVIKIRGRGLEPVVDALLAGTADFIAELKDGEGVPEAGPVIRSIEILASQPSPS